MNDDDPRPQNPNCRPGVQAYFAYLERTTRGTPGGPVENPEPFEAREKAALVDGPVAPPPEKPKKGRKRRAVKPEELEPTRDIELARYARKLKGEP